MNQCDLGRHPSCDTRRRVQGDRLPNQIGALRRHLMFGAELASSVRAVDLEAILAPIGWNQSEIMQNCAAEGGLFIDHRAPDASHSKTAEDEGSEAMGAEELRRAGFQ